MDVSVQCSSEYNTNKEKEKEERIKAKVEVIISSLPKEKGWLSEYTYQYQGFWYHPLRGLEGVIHTQENFKPRPTDILIATNPKSGTTWLKALVFAIMSRAEYHRASHPLLTSNPHACVPYLELNLFRTLPFEDPSNFPSPRVLATHIPYTSLPQSVLCSVPRIVYICRNPKDVLVSLWHFTCKIREMNLPPLSLQEAFDMFCKGVSPFGPFWDHALGYWNAYLEYPDRILFLKYEDLKREPLNGIKELAEFLGAPFSLEEEGNGVVEEILNLCSFENMSNLGVNKDGRYSEDVKNNAFFRRAKVGDWENYLTVEMAETLDQITAQKFCNSGLSLEVTNK